MERRWRRSLLLVAGSAVALGTPAILAWPGFAATAPRTMSVSSPATLASALATARPGDRILVADGSYGTPLTLTRSGTATAPITIAARNTGGVRLTDADAIRFGTVSNVVVEGFTFTGDASLTVPPAAAAVRITRNTFASNRSGNLVTVSADNSEVDHNAFLNKSTAGVYLQISGPGSSGMAKNVHIHHNWFFNHHFGGANGGESLRLGLSGRQHADAHALVELNLFEKANGDSEAISVKSSDNIVRYNTILNSRGTLSLRHGWGTLVEGNLLIGGTTGIRFFGNNHVVINNVVQGTTGQALEIGGGEIRDDTRSTRAHEAADHCLVAFNTFQSSRAGAARYGSDKKFDPSDITLADNIFVDRGGALLTGTGTQLRDEGNVLFGGTPGSFPKGTFRMVDPRLVPGDGGLLRLSSGSPAIDAGVGGYPMVSLDMDGQSRTGPKDVGADEFGAAGPQHRPLTAADVGPKAP
ncbi:MAG: lyase [Actinobacteria bacterium]|nr:MAG: lyase [Actinomycetota bacterium]